MAGTVEFSPLFDYMVLREPDSVPQATLRRDYIQDDLEQQPILEMNMRPAGWGSEIGQLVTDLVFGDVGANSPETAMDVLKAALLEKLVKVVPVWHGPLPPPGDPGPVAFPISELEKHATISDQDQTYLVADTLELLGDDGLLPTLRSILPTLHGGGSFSDLTTLTDQLLSQLGHRSLREIVFGEARYADGFVQTRRSLFDSLYVAYIMRRWTSVDLTHLMDGIRALHAIEALAVDEIVAEIVAGTATNEEKAALRVAATPRFPALQDWNWDSPDRRRGGDLPLVPDLAAFAIYMQACPVIHPIFARLFHYQHHFNDVKPIGIGDLKVVKQWLIAYEPGEISDIHNIMLGEVKVRSHRRLEKTEELFSLSSTTDQETSRDTQSTERFEVKAEAEQVIKDDIAGNANASVTYNQMPVVATVTAGFSASHSDARTDKSSHNFAREVVSKAVDRVVTHTTQQRQVTKTFETEERNRHSFSNVKGTGHVSGIYRWVDKRYEAQVYDYGKRLMFEFLIPEPAAFLVEQRLRAYEATLDLPKRPIRVPDDALTLGFGPSDINQARFNTLRLKYDLSSFEYPVTKKTVALASQGGTGFAEQSLSRDNLWHDKTYRCSVGATGYQVDKIHVNGNVQYMDHNQPPGANDQNIARLSLDGTIVWQDEQDEIYVFYDDGIYATSNGPFVLTRDELSVGLTFQDVDGYNLEFSAEVSLTPDGLLDWQTKVYNTVRLIEQKPIDDRNQERQLTFESEMSTYRSRLEEVKATAIHELLQGASSLANQAVMMRELKRGCLAQLTKEFDAEPPYDDLLTDWETMGARSVGVTYRAMIIDESTNPPSANFDTLTHELDFPAVILDEAQKKAKYVQFLEQAFEWEQLGYICYPYFWATPPKWVELMARSDDTDPFLTDFLQAGSAKVLLAVSPAYDDAVLHFLATREPWLGGDAPVLGDPLYLPMYEEIRQAQDDRYGGKPVGEAWTFTVPTSLTYLEGSEDKLPVLPQPPAA